MRTAPPIPDTTERLQIRLAALEQERKHLLAVIEILQEIAGTLNLADIVHAVTQVMGLAPDSERAHGPVVTGTVPG